MATRTATARNLLRNKQKAKPGQTQGVEASKAVEVREYLQIKTLITQLEEMIDTRVMPILENNEASYVIQDQSFVDEIALALVAIRAQFAQLTGLYTQWATEAANGENISHRTRFVDDIDDAIGVNVGFLLNPDNSQVILDTSIRNNANLIGSVPQQAVDQIENIIMEGIRTGESPADIRTLLTERYGVADSRAKLIARDQVSKLSGALSRARQSDIGVTSYRWRTSQDERVRQTHRANNGKTFLWNKPPSRTGAPGHDIQCRCVAEPVLDHLLA